MHIYNSICIHMCKYIYVYVYVYMYIDLDRITAAKEKIEAHHGKMEEVARKQLRWKKSKKKRTEHPNIRKLLNFEFKKRNISIMKVPDEQWGMFKEGTKKVSLRISRVEEYRHTNPRSPKGFSKILK